MSQPVKNTLKPKISPEEFKNLIAEVAKYNEKAEKTLKKTGNVYGADDLVAEHDIRLREALMKSDIDIHYFRYTENAPTKKSSVLEKTTSKPAYVLFNNQLYYVSANSTIKEIIPQENTEQSKEKFSKKVESLNFKNDSILSKTELSQLIQAIKRAPHLDQLSYHKLQENFNLDIEEIAYFLSSFMEIFGAAMDALPISEQNGVNGYNFTQNASLLQAVLGSSWNEETKERLNCEKEEYHIALMQKYIDHLGKFNPESNPKKLEQFKIASQAIAILEGKARYQVSPENKQGISKLEELPGYNLQHSKRSHQEKMRAYDEHINRHKETLSEDLEPKGLEILTRILNALKNIFRSSGALIQTGFFRGQGPRVIEEKIAAIDPISAPHQLGDHP